MQIPILKLELDHMRHSMAIALTEYTQRLDETLHQAVEAYCTPENLTRVINEQVEKTMGDVIKDEVRVWFTHGDGRKVIIAEVQRRLSEDFRESV